MRLLKRLCTSVLIAGVLVGMLAPVASAAPRPRAQAVANPAQAAAIIASFTGEDFSQITRRLARGNLSLPAGDPMDACAAMEAGIVEEDFEFRLTYPYTFYGDVPSEELPPGWPLLRANNRRQCANALYVYHSLAPYFFGG